jgi:hypothetical protein
VRILIERRDGNRWHWRLNAFGEEYQSPRSEASPVKAAEQVENHLTQIELSRHIKTNAQETRPSAIENDRAEQNGG